MGLERILTDVSKAISILAKKPTPVSGFREAKEVSASDTLSSLILDCMNCPDSLEKDIYIMAAVALSVFHSDGIFSPDEEVMIDEFLQNLNMASFSPDLSEKIASLKMNPPGFAGIMEMVKTISRDKWPVIDKIINISVHADSVITEQEIEYLRLWNEIYKPE